MGNQSSKSLLPKKERNILINDIKNVLGNDRELYAFPGDALFKIRDVKPYNLDRVVKPFCVTYPTTAEQVAGIVKLAAERGFKVQARGGGHSYANYCIGGKDGAVVIDMKNFQSFSLDPTTNHATVGAGTLLGTLDSRLLKAGNRSIPHGTCPQVGISGHATIGGLGPTSRMWGTMLDHIVSVLIVLADGSIVRASSTQNPDVFWAIRGAGASFGVITEFEMRTEIAPPECVQFSYAFTVGSYTSMATSFKAWQKFVADPSLTRQFTSEVIITEVGMVIKGTYFGSRDAFDALDLEGRIGGKCQRQTIVFKDFLGALTHWAEEVALGVGGGIAAPLYTKSLTFNGCNLIPEPVIDALFKYLDKVDKGTLIWFLIFDLEGGKINDVGMDETAYAHRDALFYLQSYAVGIPRVKEKTREFLRGISQTVLDGMDSNGFGAYAGYVDPELVDGQKQYWLTNLPRLEKIKLAIDPEDVFSNPQSVRPEGSPPDPPFVAQKRSWLKWLCVR